MKNLRGKTVLITGGGSGIGKSMGRLVLERGSRLIIWDINPENIANTMKEFSGLGEVYSYQLDVSNPAQVQENARLVKSRQGAVDVLINNAGIVVGKYFHEHNLEDIDRTMDVNAKAPMYISREFLPEMLARNSGHICNIASSAGLTSNPKMSVYAASKWALIGWSDSLRLELQQMKKEVKVTTVNPYYIDTGMFKGVRSTVPLLKQEKVAAKIIRAIEEDKIFLTMPWSTRFVRFSQGVLPLGMYDWFTGRVLGIYKTMEHFEGRKEQ